MAYKALPDVSVLRQLLDCDSDRGKLYWRRRDEQFYHDAGARDASRKTALWNARFGGREAFTSTNADGYKVGMILGGAYVAHRVIWSMASGDLVSVDDQIDHINHIPSDNRFRNLRVVTQVENSRNRSKSKRNSSGENGVSWNRANQNWQVDVPGFGGSPRASYVGSYATISEAIRARDAAYRTVGFHRNHGK